MNLKPCPICGGKAEFIEVGNEQVLVRCTDISCLINPATRTHSTHEAAAKQWNEWVKWSTKDLEG